METSTGPVYHPLEGVGGNIKVVIGTVGELTLSDRRTREVPAPSPVRSPIHPLSSPKNGIGPEIDASRRHCDSSDH